MPPRFAALAPVRKEVRGICLRAPTHIVDRVDRDTGVSQLKSYQRREVTMELSASAVDDRTTVRGTLHLASDFFTDLERFDADVGTDRHNEIGRIVGKRFDGLGNDAGHGAAPPGMHGANISGRWMPNQNRYAIGRARGNREASFACNERIAFHFGNSFGGIGGRNLSHLCPMHLPLLEETTVTNPEALRKACAVFANRVVVIP
jgi:hypothetical protein